MAASTYCAGLGETGDGEKGTYVVPKVKTGDKYKFSKGHKNFVLPESAEATEGPASRPAYASRD